MGAVAQVEYVVVILTLFPASDIGGGLHPKYDEVVVGI